MNFSRMNNFNIMLADLHEEINDHTSDSQDGRPVIGISANRKEGLSCIADPYFQSVVMAGGAPVLIPVTTDISALTSIIDRLDGFILSGGGDINPACFNEEPIPELGNTDIYRDEYDFSVLKLAFDRQLPIFGICRGHQVINVAFGGTIYQDVFSQYPQKVLKHSQKEARDVATHPVTLLDVSSRLRAAFSIIFCPQKTEAFPLTSSSPTSPEPLQRGNENCPLNTIPVNSFHHQAVKDLAPEFVATAFSPDGIVEAMEHPEYSIFSVQWHPEPMAVAGNEMMLNLFRYHVRQSSIFAKAKKLHQRIITVDSHTDTPTIAPSFDLGQKGGGKVNLPLMREGLLDAVFMAVYIPQGARDELASLRASLYTAERLIAVKTQAEKYAKYMGIAKTPNDLWQLKQAGKKAVFLAIENGYAIGKILSNLKTFKEYGVSYMTLCHNGNNDICDSVADKPEWGGLSPFGVEVVAEMNRLNMLIDVSHAAESTFYDVLKYSKKPVFASHSSSRALCNHHRNLDDDHIRALAAKGGVVQVCLYKPFINEAAEKASLSDAIRHLLHIIDIAGIDHVGIGSDFDGDGELIGCRAANELMQITIRLIAEGFDDESIAKIWGGNLLKLMTV